MRLSDRLREQQQGPRDQGPYPAGGPPPPPPPAPAGLRPRLAPSTPIDAVPDALAELKAQAHEALFARLGVRLFDSTITEQQLHAYVAREITELMSSSAVPLSVSERQRLVEEITDDVLGLGPVERFLADDTVTEVMVNATDPIYVERDGVIERTDARFMSHDHVRRVIERIVAQVGRRI